MAAPDILFGFILLVVGLFVIPRLFERLKIPGPITEFFLGVVVAFWIPGLISEQLIDVFAIIGVVTVFLFAGMEVDLDFLRENAKMLRLSVLSHVFLFVFITLVLYSVGRAGLLESIFPGIGGLSLVAALLSAVVLLTPSSGFIVSMLNTSSVKAGWQSVIKAKALSAEIMGIAVLTIFLNVGDLAYLGIVLVSVSALILLLPFALRFFYQLLKIRMGNIKFSFFFVIALASAFVTEMLGLHYIVGAFVAGVFIFQFMERLVEEKRVSKTLSNQLMEAMNFLSVLFVPFYFFSVGLDMRPGYFSWPIVSIAFGLCVVVSILRVFSVSGLQAFHFGSFRQQFKAASALLPTLMFGFIVAELLLDKGFITQQIFAVLIWYAIFTSITSVFVKSSLESERNDSPR